MPTLTGSAAIEYARTHAFALSKYEDPTEGHRTGLSVSEAEEVVREDPALIYLKVPMGSRFTVKNSTSGEILLQVEYGVLASAADALAEVAAQAGVLDGGWGPDIIVHEYWPEPDGSEAHHEIPACEVSDV